MANILNYPIISDIVLPFILVFVLVFAILEKSKLLGDGKKQINAIVGFVVAAIVVGGFSIQVEWLKGFSVFLAVAVFIYFVFMLLWGFAFGTKDGDVFKEQKAVKWVLGGLAFVAVVIAGLFITGTWDKVKTLFNGGETGANIFMVVIIVIAIAAVLYGSGKGKEEKKE